MTTLKSFKQSCVHLLVVTLSTKLKHISLLRGLHSVGKSAAASRTGHFRFKEFAFTVNSRLLPAFIMGIALSPCVTMMAQTTAATPTVNIDWNAEIGTTRTTITLQVVENPPLRRGSTIHDTAWSNLGVLRTDMTRLAFWYPYPWLAVAELTPPTKSETSWNFVDIDPIFEDFFHSTAGHSRVLTMSTIPTWMFRDANPGTVPESPDEAMWNYEAGTELRDPSGHEVADYFARVAGWYGAGGFTDETGKRHVSTHRERLDWWEVLNEPEYEHAFDIRTYTKIFDSVVAAVHAVSPSTRFVGMSLAEPSRSPESFEYFLNPANHEPGIPLDAISYHFYADAEPGETDATEPYTFFARTDAFLGSVRFIESIRKRLSPRTQTHINEVGCIEANDLAQGTAHTDALPSSQYWNLCGTVFAYLYAGLAKQGIEVIGSSQLVGYPTQFPSVSLLDWGSAQPNARYRVLQLLHEALGPGDRIVKVSVSSHDVFAAGYVSPSGERKTLLINKRSVPIVVRLPGAHGAVERHVDVVTAASALADHSVNSDLIRLEGLSVMVIRAMPKSSR